MRLARQILNAVLETGLENIDHTESVYAISVLRRLGLVFALTGVKMPDLSDPWMLECIKILSRATVATPYGVPLKFSQPLIVSVSVGNNCPFSCSNCYSRSGPTGVVSEITTLDTFHRVSKLQTPFVIITGGEPLASEQLFDGLTHVLSAGKFVYLSTNASVVPILPLLTAYPRQISLVLPVWGDHVEQDRLRGPGSQARLIKNVKLLSEVGAPIVLLAVLSKPDLSLFENVLSIARANTIRNLTVTRQILVGRSESTVPWWTSTFAKQLHSRMAEFRGIVNTIDVDIPELRRANSARSSIVEKLFGIPSHVECSAGNWYMHMGADGTAYPCFSCEGRQRLGAVDPSLDVQWRDIQRLRGTMNSTVACCSERKVYDE